MHILCQSYHNLVNKKKYSFRKGPGLIDIMGWKKLIHLSHKPLLLTAHSLKSELAEMYLLICIMSTLSSAIALISSVYYCTDNLQKVSNLTQFVSVAELKKKEEAAFCGNGKGEHCMSWEHSGSFWIKHIKLCLI